MLTATEKQRVKNFTADMDDKTASSMLGLFELTKPGCTRFTNALFISAHTGQALPSNVVHAFFDMGLVNRNGSIPRGIQLAIRKAVAEKFLSIHDPWDPILRPDDPSELVLH